MPLFRNKKDQAVRPTEPVLPPGPELLRDRSLLAQWYIRHRLDEEMARAVRYGYPLTLAILKPDLPPGHVSPAAFVAVGARAAQTAARSTDLIGWLDDQCILIILPHSDAVSAAAAIERWRTEITMRSWHVAGGMTWRIAAASDASPFADGAAFLDAARQQLSNAA
jgi:hypothetical protein